MRYPEFIRDGGTIGFVAPSFGCASEPYESAFKNALKEFTRRGYKTVLGPNCFASDGIGISSSSKSCAKELTDFYTSTENDILISCGGGELMCGILPFVDFDAIGKAPAKWFMGYSDNTNFTFLNTTLCDTASIYGPCAGAFGMEPWDSAICDSFDVITGKKLSIHSYKMWEKESLKDETNPLAPYNLTEKTILKFYPESLKASGASFSGRLLGGNLDILTGLCGTKFDHVNEFTNKYANDGIIWFLEACDLNVMSIRRALWQLDNAGWFNHVKGFIIGRPLHFDEPMMGLDRISAVTGQLNRFDVPIIMDADIGHLPPAMPIISGAFAEVNAQKDELIIDYHLS